MANVTVPQLRGYLKHNFNVLLRGRHGTGKTMMLMEACAAEGLTLKVFNASSMDPFTDLVGVPKFVTDADGNDDLKSVRPHEVDDADVVFIDELNRAGDPKITNAVFEMIQFGTINGEKLPKLRCVVAAINPPDDEDYDVQPLDPALIDRFHITLDMEPRVDLAYMTNVFGRDLALALSKWYNQRDKKAGYVSPRRAETLGRVFVATRSLSDLKAAFPPDGQYNVGELYKLLNEVILTPDEKVKNEEVRMRRASERKAKKDAPALGFINDLNANLRMQPKNIRKYGPTVIRDAMKLMPPTDPVNTPAREAIAAALAGQIPPEKIFNQWVEVFGQLTKDEVAILNKKWDKRKKDEVIKYYIDYATNTSRSKSEKFVYNIK